MKKQQISNYIYLIYLILIKKIMWIIKTTYLRQIQRKWKAIYKERKRVIRLRCNLHNIHYREIYGKWPNNCFHLPTLQCH